MSGHFTTLRSKGLIVNNWETQNREVTTTTV